MTKSRAFKALLAITLLSAFSGCCDARSLQQASAPSPAVSAEYGATLLAALEANSSLSGPILYKTYDAAYYALAAETGVYTSIPATYQHTAIPIGTDGSQVLLVVDPDLAIVHLAFSAGEATTAAMTGPVTPAPVTFLTSFFAQGTPPSVSSAAWSGFAAAEEQIMSALDQLSGGNVPIRVVCTGHAGGGAWAQLCGPWAQISFPYANVRVITFGAPRIGDYKWTWAFAQLVDLAYVWVTQSDITPTLPATLLPTNLTRTIADNNTVTGTGAAQSLEYYVTTLNNTIQLDNSNIPVTLATNFSYGFLPSEAASANAPPAGAGGEGDISSFVGNVKDSFSAVTSTVGHEVGEAVSSIFGGDASPPPPAATSAPSLGGLGSGAPTPGGAPGKPQGTGGAAEDLGTGHLPDLPVISKIQLPIQQDCDVYNDGPNTIAPGSINIGPLPDVGTDCALYWNESDQTAVVAFRGSSSTDDWVQDFKLWLTESPANSYFQELYPDTQVHAGFLEQFRAVTDQAQNDSVSILAQLNLLSQNAVPTRIECTGHSLGAGLATLCGVWASEQWPQSDVRVVTFGSPKVGNTDFAQSVLATVGRTYRVVNMLDEVPSLPPITSYVHVDDGLWVTNGTVVLDERPPLSIGDLSWDYHGCDDHYEVGIQMANGTTIPEAVLFAA